RWPIRPISGAALEPHETRAITDAVTYDLAGENFDGAARAAGVIERNGKGVFVDVVPVQAMAVSLHAQYPSTPRRRQISTRSGWTYLPLSSRAVPSTYMEGARF